MTLAARLGLYLQLLLGTLQSPGMYNDVPGILHTHRTLAFVVPVLSFLAFTPMSGPVNATVRVFARYGPLVSLAVGLINWIGFKTMGVMPSEAYLPVIVLHIVVGLAVVAVTEIASGQFNRAKAQQIPLSS